MTLLWWHYLLYFILLFALELVTTTLYNYKIIQVSKDKWNIAAINGALATFAWTTFSLFISYFSIESSQLWLIFASVISVGIGTFFGTYLMHFYPSWIAKLKSKFSKTKKESN